MRFRKVYVEISNICNMHCSFCPGTKRAKRQMTKEEFARILPKLRPYTDFLYFHLMGEPLRHPELKTFLALAGELGFKVILTTNGTLLKKNQEMLLSAKALHKVNISVHAFEANPATRNYLQELWEFGKVAEGRKLVVYRLWNSGGLDRLNERILAQMHQNFPGDWVQERQGIRIGEKMYLEYGDKFAWPDLDLQQDSTPVFCYGLRDQLGVLCDGTVVPCCLDHEGDIALGNLLTEDLEEILQGKRAKALYDGFSGKQAVEPLCKTCGYAKRFT